MVRVCFCLLMMVVVLFSCSEDREDNTPPIITNFNIPSSVQAGDSVIFSVSARDNDGDPLAYTWFINDARHRGSETSIEWTAPDVGGTFVIEVRVSDGINELVIQSRTLTVRPLPRMAWLGIWEVVKMNGEPPAEALAQELGNEADFTLKILENQMVFKADSTFFWNFGIQISGDLGDGSLLKFSIIVRLGGTYMVEDTTYQTILESVRVSLLPREFWEPTGITEKDMENEFKNELGQIENGTWKLDGNTLSLDGDSLVLRKK